MQTYNNRRTAQPNTRIREKLITDERHIVLRCSSKRTSRLMAQCVTHSRRNEKCCGIKLRERVCAGQPMGKPSRQREEELRGRNIKEEERAGRHLFCFHNDTKMELFGAEN